MLVVAQRPAFTAQGQLPYRYIRFPMILHFVKPIERCYRKDYFAIATARLCSQHFKPDDFERDLQRELHVNVFGTRPRGKLYVKARQCSPDTVAATGVT